MCVWEPPPPFKAMAELEAFRLRGTKGEILSLPVEMRAGPRRVVSFLCRGFDSSGFEYALRPSGRS